MPKLLIALVIAPSLFLLSCTNLEITAEFSAATQTVSESEGTVTATVTLSETSQLAVRIPYTLSGTASGGGTSTDDYDGSNGTLVVPIGSQSASISFPLIAQATDPGDRTLVISLGTPENAELGDTIDHIATIQWSDGGGDSGDSGGGDSATPPSLSSSADAFYESATNDGSIHEGLSITVTGGTWTTDTLVENTHYTISGTIPSGLTIDFTRSSNTQLDFDFTGNSASHTGFDSSFFDVTFLDAAFEDGLAPDDSTETQSYFFLFSDSEIVLFSVAVADGNLGNRAATAATCSGNAPAGFGGKANFQAVISYGTGDEIFDMYANYAITPDMVVSESLDLIAGSFLDLNDGIFINDLESTSILPTSSFWWSGADNSASPGANDHCTNWTSNAGGVTGSVGTSDGTGEDWKADGSPQACNTATNRILCIGYD